MRKFIGKCDNCNHDLYDDDLYYEGKIGNLDFTLCDRCCKPFNLPESSEDTEVTLSNSDIWVNAKERLPDKSGYYLIAKIYTSPIEKDNPTHRAYVDKVSYSARHKLFNEFDEFDTPDLKTAMRVDYWMPIPDLPIHDETRWF